MGLPGVINPTYGGKLCVFSSVACKKRSHIPANGRKGGKVIIFKQVPGNGREYVIVPGRVSTGGFLGT